MRDFFEKNVPANPLKAEYLLPTHIGGLLRDWKCTVKVLEMKDKWFGGGLHLSFRNSL